MLHFLGGSTASSVIADKAFLYALLHITADKSDIIISSRGK